MAHPPTGSALLLGLLLCAAPLRAEEAGARVVLRWKPVAGALGYDVQISPARDFSKLLVDERVKVAGYRWGELPAAPHYWRVRSLDGEGRVGTWSEPREIANARLAIRLLAPADGAAIVLEEERSAVQLSAEPSRVARDYTFELSADPRFAPPLLAVKSATPLARLSLPGAGTFYWRVRADSVSSGELPASEARTLVVSLGAPRMVLPAEGTTLLEAGAAPAGIPAELRWTAPAAAVRFRVAVTRDGAPIQRLEATRTTLTLPTGGEGHYAVRITGVDAAGKESPPSAERPFTVELAAPTLVAPAPGASFGARGQAKLPELRWALNRFATAYAVQLSTDARFEVLAAGEEERASVAPDALQITGLATGTYFWRVIALGAGGFRSLSSEERSFVIVGRDPLPAPALLSPPPDAVIARDDAAPELRLAWSAVPLAAGYEISTAPSEEALPAAKPLSVPGLTLTFAPAAGRLVFRVRAVDDEGVPGRWSSASRLFFGTPPSARAEIFSSAKTLLADGASSTDVTLRLYDADGREVGGVPVQAGSSAGQLGTVQAGKDGYRVRYVAPEDRPEQGFAEITFRDRGFTTSTRITLEERPGRLQAGPRLGFRHNLGGVAGPSIGGELTYATGLLSRRLHVSLRAGFYGTSTVVAAQQGLPEVTTAVARAFPLALVAFHTWTLDALSLYAGAGPTLEVVRLQVAGETAVSAAPGLQALGGAARRLGNGELFGELALGLGTVDAPLARLRTGGLLVSAGYRFDL